MQTDIPQEDWSRNPTRFPELGSEDDNRNRLDVIERRLDTDFIKKPWFQNLGIKTDKTGRISEISANLLVGGLLQSTNWGVSDGSEFNLDAGTFRLGGSSAPKLNWDGSTLSISGSVTIVGGSIAIGTGANSMHTDSEGNSWWGASDYASAPARISKSGAIYGSSVTISGYISTGGAAADVNAGGVTINGPKITAGSLTTAQLNFVPLTSAGGTGSIVATINASSEGIYIVGSKIRISGSVTFDSGYDPTTKIPDGGAAADVNSHSVTINGGRLTAGTVTADYVRANISISAPTITGGTITGNTIYGSLIQGGVVRTAGSGQTRVELSDDDVARIRFYNGSTLLGGIKAGSSSEWQILSESGKILTILADTFRVRAVSGGGTNLDVSTISVINLTASNRVNADSVYAQGGGGSGFIEIRRQSSHPTHTGNDSHLIYGVGGDTLWVKRANGQRAQIQLGSWV
jgi:hypothetical protein